MKEIIYKPFGAFFYGARNSFLSIFDTNLSQLSKQLNKMNPKVIDVTSASEIEESSTYEEITTVVEQITVAPKDNFQKISVRDLEFSEHLL